MSQHDFNIANQLFPDTRADLNLVLTAIVTNNSGAAAPATTFGSMTYYNETDDTFYMRNKGNTAWVPVGKIVSDEWFPYIDGAQLGQGTDTIKGIWEKATVPEGVALTSDLVVLTPLVLASILATESAFGISRFGTTAETETATAADRAVSVQNLGRMWKEGAAIASATTLVEPSDANKGGVYSLTGSITVANLWAGETPGRKVQLRLAGTPQFTNSATLIIPGGTRTFAAGDVLEFTAEAANVWRLTSALLANGKSLVETVTVPSKLVQRVATSNATYTSLPTTMPCDNSIPQIGEGDQFLSQAITPTNAANIIRVTVSAGFGGSSQGIGACALFSSLGGTNALDGRHFTVDGTTSMTPVTFVYEEVAGSTSARTYTVRAGGDTIATVKLNGDNTSRTLGGIQKAWIIVEELTP